MSRDFWNMSEEELKREEAEAERLLEIINADPELRDLKPPADMLDKILESAREIWEQEEIESLSTGNKELIRLGKIYKKRRRISKYVLLVAALLVALGLGSVSMGENMGLFSMVTRFFSGGDRVVVNSEDTEPILYVNENDVYAGIEKKFGFKPVVLEYLPVNIEFQEATISDELQIINMIYGTADAANIIYDIKPNFRESSFGTTIDDKKIQEYQIEINDVVIFVTEYVVESSGKHRWSAHFEYKDVQYWLRTTNLEQEEVEKILRDLSFIE